MRSNGANSGANISRTNDAGMCYPLDVDQLDSKASAFSCAEGVEPPSVRGKSYSEGGRYRGTTPECDPIIGIDRR